MSSLAAALSSSEAAVRLGIEPGRVRALIRDGILDGQKIGGRWFVDPRSVERRKANPAGEGRPFEPRNAWALIQLWHGAEADWVNRWERSRLKRQLKLRDVREMAPALRGRAELRLFRAHPAALPRLLASDRFHPGGISASGIYGADIAASDEIEGYASSSHAAELASELYLESSPEPNVLLHVVEGPWLGLIASRSRAVPGLCVALDLIESADPRSRRAGYELLDVLSVEREDAEGRVADPDD